MSTTEIIEDNIKWTQSLLEEHLKWAQKLLEDQLAWERQQASVAGTPHLTKELALHDGLCDTADEDSQSERDSSGFPKVGPALQQSKEWIGEQASQSKEWLEENLSQSREWLETHIKESRERFEHAIEQDRLYREKKEIA